MSFSMVLNFVLWLLVGISVFLFGLKIMGDGLERLASNKMRKILTKISDNRLVGVGAGAGITAVIHSSAAMTVMVIGFVNANLMTLTQAAGLIFGANIGTTVTGLLVAFGSFDIEVYLALPVFIGLLITFISKKEATKRIGHILIGMGLIFIGLSLMSDSMGDIGKTAEFKNIFEVVKNPLLLMLIGIVVTALVQSSTAVNTIVLVLAAQGSMPIVSALYIILGTNVGTCVTALLASVDTGANAKRASMIHLLFNIIGTVLFAAFFLTCDLVDNTFLPRVIPKMFGDNPMFQIAWFNFFQNLLCTLILLPFLKPLVRLASFLVRDKVKSKSSADFKYINERYLDSPPLAVVQVLNEIMEMNALAKVNLTFALNALESMSLDDRDKLLANERRIDELNRGITNFLVKLSGINLNDSDKVIVGSLFHVVSDLERIGDHADNLMEFADVIVTSGLVFSDGAKEEITLLGKKVLAFFEAASAAFENRDQTKLRQIGQMESEIDTLTKRYAASHVQRMTEGTCNPENGIVFYGIITNLERIADHLNNMAYSIRIRTNQNKKTTDVISYR